jgi:sulfite exporter TauE/SafE
MTGVDVSLGFTLGLVGSLHCTQMCGPIVLAYSLPLGAQSRLRQVAAHAAYNAGRVLTYAMLGAIAGALGGGLTELGHIAGIFNTAAVVAGTVMVLAGIWMTGVVPTPRLIRRISSAPGASWTQTVARYLRSPSPLSKLAMGIVLGFMPCGLIYAALLKAVETGTPAAGALTMAAFGAGTAGALVATGMFSGVIARVMARAGRWLPAAGVVTLGIFLVWRGLAGVAPQVDCPFHPGMKLTP